MAAPRIQAEEDVQWDYEYSTTETEDYYVTVDLTTPSPHALTGQQSQDGSAQRVQILDLHTRNPVISYDGQVFSCKWGESIGTDLLFTKHDQHDPSSNVQTLPGNVDLLAATSLRLISTPLQADLKPGMQAVVQFPVGQHNRVRAEDIDPRSLKIDPGSRSGSYRIRQAKFLEDMIASKESRGEKDRVTIFCKKRYTNDMWKKEILKIRASKREDDRAALAAVMDDEEERPVAEREMKRLKAEEMLLVREQQQNRRVRNRVENAALWRPQWTADRPRRPPQVKPKRKPEKEKSQEMAASMSGDRTPHYQSITPRPIAPRPLLPQPTPMTAFPETNPIMAHGNAGIMQDNVRRMQDSPGMTQNNSAMARVNANANLAQGGFALQSSGQETHYPGMDSTNQPITIDDRIDAHGISESTWALFDPET